MIAMAAKSLKGDRSAAVIGLTQDNIERMTMGGGPIHLDAKTCEQLGLGDAELFIFYGTNEVTMVERLERGDMLPKGMVDDIKADIENGTHDDLSYGFSHTPSEAE